MKMTKNIFESLNKDLYTLYIIRLYDDVESFYKIGVTSRENPYERFSSYPYEKDIICLYQHPSSHLIMDLESKCISLETKYTPRKEFGGKSECVESINNASEFLGTLTWIKDLKEYVKPNRRRDGQMSVDTLVKTYDTLSKEEQLALLEREPLFKYWIINCGLTVQNINSCNKSIERINELAEACRKLEDLSEDLINFLKVEVGQIYPSAELKTKIQNYYENNGIPKKAKGTDISQWFEIKKSSTIIDGIKVNALKLIRKL